MSHPTARLLGPSLAFALGVLLTVLALSAHGRAAAQVYGSFSGTPPTAGSGLLAVTEQVSVQALVADLRAAGCGLQSIQVTVGSELRTYTPGSESTANARFPSTLAAATPILVSCAPPPLTIFDDALQQPWLDISWGVTSTRTSGRIYEGRNALQVRGAGAFALRHGPWSGGIDIDPAGYRALRFAIFPETSGFELSVALGNDSEQEWYGGFSVGWVPAGRWTVVEVPMSRLNPRGLVIHKLFIASSGGEGSSYRLDGLVLDADPHGLRGSCR